MEKGLKHLSCVLLIVLFLMTSCQKEYSCESCREGNKPPIAQAGRDTAIALPADSVTLDGTASTDPDGSITEYQWTKVSGPSPSNISHPARAITSAKGLQEGVYLFELSVKDNGGLSAKDTVVVTVDIRDIEHPPVACAGSDQTITLPVNKVTLDGSCSSDPDNNIISFVWTKIGGSSATITNANMAQTEVNNLTQGVYQFELKVTDVFGLTSKDTVQVTVNQQANNTLVDIYVAGYQNSLAAYWKNGQQVTLRSGSLNSSATSIAVSGNDVYVAGWEGDFFMYANNKAKYWKNGEEVLLTGATGAAATSIAVVGSDVYVAGWELNGSKTVAKYWKNGQPVALTNGLTDAEATCIVVVNGNIYVAGYEKGVAKYWKNGHPVSLTHGSYQAYANSIAVSGNDVYVAGSESNGTAHIAKYWKNGQVVSLTNGSAVHATATSIAVVGSDVYVAGWEGDFYGRAGGSGSAARYWKNGQVVPITNGTTYAYTSSLAFFGSDVYVAGSEYNGSLPVATYWKSGQAAPTKLATDAWATNILVVPR